MIAPAAMVVDRPRIGAMPMKATPSVPAVVHELPVTAPTTAQISGDGGVEDRRLEDRDPVGHDGRDRAGHVPGADQRPDGQEDEERAHRRGDPPMAASRRVAAV